MTEILRFAFAGKRKYRPGHTKHRKVPQSIGLLTPHFHMIKPELTRYNSAVEMSNSGRAFKSLIVWGKKRFL